MLTTVYVLYLITNLGQSFELTKVIEIYKTEQTCIARKNKIILSKDYMRVECKPEDFYD